MKGDRRGAAVGGRVGLARPGRLVKAPSGRDTPLSITRT